MKRKIPFETLRKQWYAKLAPAGFRDIECESGLLKKHRSCPISNADGVSGKAPFKEAIQEYYRWAGHMVFDGKFKSAKDRRIWQMHAEGCHHGEIAAAVKLERSWVSRRIRMMEKSFKSSSR